MAEAGTNVVKAGGCMAEVGANALECLQETEKCQRAENFGWGCFRPAGRERVLKKCKKMESMRVWVVFPLTSAYLLFIILGLLKAIFVQAGQKYRACSIIGERV